MTSETTIRTRFAPSPSGHLHVGGARTALFCWAYARGRGGRFLLRIEDTDQRRSSEAASLGFLEDLAWLGIDWDEGPEWEGLGGGDAGPYFQSKRLAIYDEQIERLIAAGAAYRAFETPEEIDAQRAAARAAKTSWRYDRAALELDDATVAAWVAEGKPHVVRFRSPETAVTVTDAVLGDVTLQAEELDDFVIRKADGFPTYHLAVVVDDALMGVSHVIRGQEHLNNTAKHVLLQDALGFARPVTAHLSLIFNPDGSKMSKRDKDKALRAAVRERGIDAPPVASDGSPIVSTDVFETWRGSKKEQLDVATGAALAAALHIDLPEINVDDFRRAGYLPDVLVNYMALLGWSPGGDVEHFDRAFLIERFDLDRVIRAPAKFDRQKLLSFNLDAVQALAPEAFEAKLREWCERYHPAFIAALGDRFALFAAINQSRCKTFHDAIATCGFFVAEDDAIAYTSSKATRKALTKGEPSGAMLLEKAAPVLAGLADFEPATIEAALGELAEHEAGGRLGNVAQPLRIAVSGTTVSPAIFETLSLLGAETVQRRIARCLAAHPDIVAQV